AEVGDHRLAVLAHRAVPLDAHRVAGGVQGLAADHDRVQVEVVLFRVPAAVADPAVQLEQLHRVQAAAPGHAVLPVGGEGHVPRLQGAARADLGRFLAQQRGPDAQLALALQGDRLEVDPADQDQVPVQRPELLGRDFQRVAGVVGPFALRGEELDELPGARLRGQTQRIGPGSGWTIGIAGHAPLLAYLGPVTEIVIDRPVYRPAVTVPP